MTQKVIKVGNSLAVVLPSSFVKKSGYKAGDEIDVDTNDEVKTMYIRPKNCPDLGLTPEFKSWLDKVAEKEKDTIQALAKA